ncbi:MAG: hypothetical protein JSS69_00845 [Acidobacteria bacterium]|nr:hypothetical protein [Acidobacteriota bacterium]
MNVETANSNPSNNAARCAHQFENGTRCRLPVLAADSAFCPRHARLGQNQPVEEDFREKLLKNSQDFQTAQGINFALGNLYDLVAQNRISTRRAAVLAYINSLLLRTLPAIDYDRQNKITDPRKTSALNDSFLGDLDPTKKPS